MSLLLEDVILAGGQRTAAQLADVRIVTAETPAELAAYHRLRRDVFVAEQGIFSGSDHDDVDDDPRTQVLIARGPGGELLGGVRIHPMTEPDLGWWRGSRLAVDLRSRMLLGVGTALIRAACAAAENAGALRFDATIQAQNEGLFKRLGWVPRERIHLHQTQHVVVDWPIDRTARLAAATKASLGPLLAEVLGHDAWRGDDGTPVPGSDVIAATDAILPSMVERDPEWAGWCAVLVNINDICAMGAAPVGLTNALGARDASFARRVLRGLDDAARAWEVPVLGGHTQLGVPASLSATAFGRTDRPVPGGGGTAGDVLRLTADLGGGWRPGYAGSQWDSTTRRAPEQLRAQAGVVPALAPYAAKDVSMAGVVGTAGMLAEASGVRAVLDVADVPTPSGAGRADWLSCFPGFAILSAHAGHEEPRGLPDHLTTAACGELVEGSGVALRWPDGVVTEAATTVTGLGPATTTGRTPR